MKAKEHILFADDDEIFMHTTAKLLQRSGYTCICTKDTDTVLQLAEHESYDLLISDIMMPGNQRLELIKRWAQLGQGTPVILITGRPTIESAILAIHLPVMAYLVKPFDFTCLLAEVRNVIARTKAFRLAQASQQSPHEWKIQNSPYTDVRQALLYSKYQHEAPEAFTKIFHNIICNLTELHSLTSLLIQEQAQAKKHSLQNGAECKLSSNQDWYEESINFPTEQIPAEVLSALRRLSQCKSSPLPDWYDQNGNSPIIQIPAEVLSALRRLSRRERDILRLLLNNYRLPTLAKTLYISPHTARNHLHAIFRKFSVHSQDELLSLLNSHTVIKEWL